MFVKQLSSSGIFLRARTHPRNSFGRSSLCQGFRLRGSDVRKTTQLAQKIPSLYTGNLCNSEYIPQRALLASWSNREAGRIRMGRSGIARSRSFWCSSHFPGRRSSRIAVVAAPSTRQAFLRSSRQLLTLTPNPYLSLEIGTSQAVTLRPL